MNYIILTTDAGSRLMFMKSSKIETLLYVPTVWIYQIPTFQINTTDANSTPLHQSAQRSFLFG